ncbi:probable ribonuclease ZC3H12C isoform X2 [Daktulosphaira vitifoliae]|uniref:probable ribonuclease ZC3H12C isoform X2 n=1 Tax=Daktulosphaira vitifoliae TaxID=58002 RepID=UPI0021AA6089|nr:probable ribonuclease ZC3H12C isoform X2 [Daktulosphaira vitifoliae]
MGKRKKKKEKLTIKKKLKNFKGNLFEESKDKINCVKLSKQNNRFELLGSANNPIIIDEFNKEINEHINIVNMNETNSRWKFVRKNKNQLKKINNQKMKKKNIILYDEIISIGRKLRPIAIDAKNVALLHSINQEFSAKGIEICVNWFKTRGHLDIVAFLTKNYLEDKNDILKTLEKEGHICYTPIRDNFSQSPSYERVILDYASHVGAAVVSNDNYNCITDDVDIFNDILYHRTLKIRRFKSKNEKTVRNF